MRIGKTRIVSEGEKKANEGCCVVVLVLITLGLTGVAIFTYGTYKDLKETVLVLNPQSADPNNPSPMLNGRVIHVASNNVTTERPAGDADFGISIAGGFFLKRETEYCQWHETYIDTERESEGRERTERTYYYTKGWSSTPIVSLFFDQAAAHHNPQRDPYPSKTTDSVAVMVASYTIPATMTSDIKGKDTILRWEPGHLGWFYQSPAFNLHKFFYTADDGWFYSAYQTSMVERLIKGAMQYAEGTLFDYQIGDLFSVCTAGDIRVRYHTVIPQGGVSFIGKQVDSANPSHVTTFTSVNGNEMAFTREGIHSIDEIMAAELNSAKWHVRLWSVLWAISTVISTLVCFNYYNKNIKPKSS